MKALLCLIFCLGASDPSRGEAQPNPIRSPLAQNLIPPDLVMRYQDHIKLDGGQRSEISRALAQAENQILATRWELKRQEQRVIDLLHVHPIDEQGVLAQMDRLLDIEREIKRAQMSLLIRISNSLTEPQRETLLELGSTETSSARAASDSGGRADR